MASIRDTLYDMVGKTVGHFKVIEKIGSGGMGIVYKAQDLTLDRIVALKSLPPGAIDDKEAMAWLIQEAKTASILDHPNICTIYEVSQTREGQVFIAMAYYEGETLSKKLRRGPLPFRQAVGIAEDIALGLSKAHRHGVIHRDVKPGNIIVTTDGVVKILDFGIAELASMAAARIGTAAGTIAYMSPEHLSGELIDQRTDIWSWGIVLFEMLTGRVPFQTQKRRALVRAIVSERFELPNLLQNTVPSGLVQVLSKTLQKNPADRYSRIDEALSELQRSCSPATDSQGHSKQTAVARVDLSIAVLPFRSLSLDPEDEYFSHGLTEELTDALILLEGLHVAPRTSVFAIKDAQGLAETAARLRVGLILEGTVRRRGNRLRINVRLVDVGEDRVLWSERFDRDMTDVFAVQEDIAGKVAGTLKIHLGDERALHLVKRYTKDLRAYNLYLKGRYQWNRESPASLFKAVETLAQAAEADHDYVLPLCGLAECYLVMGARGLLPPADAWRKARDASQRALVLNPKLADAHGCLGAVLAINDFDWEAAEREFRYGLELDAESASTRHWYAISLLAPQGRFDEALAETTQAIERDPVSLIYNSTLAWVYYLAGRCEEAVEQCAKTLEIDPNHPDSLWCMGSAHRELGRPQEAIAALKKLEEVAAGLPLVYASLGHGYAVAGNTAEAEKMLRAVQETGRRTYSSPICESWVYANLPGQQDAALDCLERAYTDRDFLIRYIHMSRSLKSVWTHPRFHALVHRMGLTEPPTQPVKQAATITLSSIGSVLNGA